MKYNCEEVINELTNRKNYLERMLQKANVQNEKWKEIPTYKIRVQKHGKSYQYYMRTDKKDTSGKYLKRNQDKLVRQTFQKEYIQKMILAISKEIEIIDAYIKKNPPTQLQNIYDRMSDGRKVMIDPLEISNEEYAKRWSQVSYIGKGFPPEFPEYYTQKMERVRSKSEIIIANTLEKYHVPYRYEYPVQVKGMGTIYPDFTTLNVKKRKEIYIEHFGLLDDKEYRENTLQKLELYEQNNITLGDNLIATFETAEHPLNVKSLERKIKHYLL